MTSSVKRKELENIRLLLRGLNVPHDFMSQHEKYNWPNWPKLTMSPNGTPDTIQRDLKNVTFVLYGANLPLKECYKVNSDLNVINLFKNSIHPVFIVHTKYLYEFNVLYSTVQLLFNFVLY